MSTEPFKFHLGDRIKAAAGTHVVDVADVLTPSFLLANSDSRLASFEALAAKLRQATGATGDVRLISVGDRDRFVASMTRFTSWEEMMRAAALEWTKRKIGLNR